MKRLPVVIISVILIPSALNAQYYYRDVITVQQSLAEKKVLEQQKIRSIIVHSFEPDGKEIQDFNVEKKISKDFRKMETFSESQITGKAWQTSYYNDRGFLEKSTDSSELSVSNTTYEYDNNGRVSKITSVTQSSDDDFHTSLTEVHQYTYNEKGLPAKMRRIKNGKEISLIDFIIDDKGNVTDEIEPGINGKHYYYYYDDKKRLTDIVKYNAVKKGLRADFIFEYDDEDHVVQMITVEEGLTGDYNTWKYIYNDGLRIIEKCFSREKNLLGYVEYEYKD